MQIDFVHVAARLSRAFHRGGKERLIDDLC
jgi:hypothetical protein